MSPAVLSHPASASDHEQTVPAPNPQTLPEDSGGYVPYVEPERPSIFSLELAFLKGGHDVVLNGRGDIENIVEMVLAHFVGAHEKDDQKGDQEGQGQKPHDFLEQLPCFEFRKPIGIAFQCRCMVLAGFNGIVSHGSPIFELAFLGNNVFFVCPVKGSVLEMGECHACTSDARGIGVDAPGRSIVPPPCRAVGMGNGPHASDLEKTTLFTDIF
jgi:hypothetical protein